MLRSVLKRRNLAMMLRVPSQLYLCTRHSHHSNKTESLMRHHRPTAKVNPDAKSWFPLTLLRRPLLSMVSSMWLIQVFPSKKCTIHVYALSHSWSVLFRVPQLSSVLVELVVLAQVNAIGCSLSIASIKSCRRTHTLRSREVTCQRSCST